MITKLIPGLTLCLIIAIVSIYLSNFIVGIGSVSIALILAIIIGNLIKKKDKLNDGISFADQKILPFTIALLGAELNFYSLIPLGIPTLLFIISIIVITILSSLLIGKLFGLSKNSSILLGCGNAICGTSAIASASKLLKANEEETAISIGAVNFMGTIGIFLLPFLLNLLEYNIDETANVIGGTLQAVGHVVASGYSLGNEIGNHSLLVKMTRVLLLGPTLLILGLLLFKKNKSVGEKKFPIPIFIIGFFTLSFLATTSLIPELLINYIDKVSYVLLAVAMAGIGLKINFSSIINNGIKVAWVEILIFTIQVIFSLILIKFI